MGTCLTRLLFVCGCLSASLCVAEDWPQWRGVRGDGTWHAPPVSDHWPPAGLTEVWNRPLGPGYSGITVRDGRVYTMDRPATPADVERVLCLDVVDGQILWAHSYAAAYDDLDYGKGPRGAATVYDGRVYTLGAVGHLWCLDAKTGDVCWHHDLKSEYSARRPLWGFAASPVIHGDMVIVHAGMGAEGCFAAFDRRSGHIRWQGGSDPAGYSTPIIIQAGQRQQLIGWTPQHVLGMSLDTGQVVWQVPYKVTYGVSIATPIYQDGIVLVSGYWEGSKAIRLSADLQTAELLWEEDRQLRGLLSQPLYRDGCAYLLDKSQGLVCFELQTKRILWTDRNRMTPRGRNPQATMVWIGQGPRAIVLNSAGYLLLVKLSPGGYEELGRQQIVGETWAHPGFSDRFVYARDDQQIVCIALPADD